MPNPLAEKHYDFNPYHYVMGNPMLYIDPLGLDTGKIKDGGKLPEVKIRKVYNPNDNPFLEYLTAEQDAKRQGGLLTGYELLTSGSKRPLTPEELIEDRKRKAAQALARENKKKYDTNRDNYGKGQTKEALKAASDGLQNLGYEVGVGDVIVNNMKIGIKAGKYLQNSIKLFRHAGFAMSAASIGLDSYMLKKGFIGGGEFAYNTFGTLTSTAAGLYVGARVGGGAGAIVGFSVGITFPIAKEAGKKIYNSMNEGTNQFRNQALNSWSKY